MRTPPVWSAVARAEGQPVDLGVVAIKGDQLLPGRDVPELDHPVGADGLGQGGGVYNADAGTFEVDALTFALIQINFASDDGDDTFGPIDVL